jgi:HEAT repeats/Putative zinc-finger
LQRDMTNHDPNENANQDANEQVKDQACSEYQPLLMLSAAGGELDDAEQARLAAHLADCAPCASELEQEREALALFTAHHSEPDAAMLAGYRAGLDDALDRQEEGGWLRRALGLRLPANWLAPRPAWSAAILLIVGFAVGASAPRLFRHPLATAPSGNPTASDNSSGLVSSSGSGVASPSPAAFDLHSADVAGISLFPAGDDGLPRVQLQLKSQQPMTVEGTLEDEAVKTALLDVLSSGDRSCPDVRLDAVECLSTRRNDPDVRSALCRAVHSDRNAAVRLKALEALDGAGSQEMVRQTLLDALVEDQNPGVRIEAINALRDMAAKGQVDSDGHTLDVLRERMRKDPNTYIRLQSAAAVRDIGPRQKF